MDLKRPSRLLGAAHEPSNLLIGRWLLCEIERVSMDTPEAEGCRYPAMAAAGGLIGGQTAVGSRERFDSRAGVLEALAEQLRGYAEGLGAVRARQLQDLAEDVRQPMRTIQALKHAERTADLHLLDERRMLSIAWPV